MPLRNSSRCCSPGVSIRIQSPTAAFISGSADLYQRHHLKPFNSINFVTCHDGFTLQDLVSYNHKHNSANGEDNRDGENHNLSWNMGREGPADRNLHLLNARLQQKRNFLTTLLLSQGVPMLCAGDELGRTQQGNNNAYCQDNEISWVDWDIERHDREFMEFVCELIKLRREHPVFRRRHFFQGRRIKGANVKDISWLRPDGQEMTDEEWNSFYARCMGLLLHGDAIEEHDERGRPIHGDTFLLLLNAHSQPIPFRLPKQLGIARWGVTVDTCFADGKRADRRTFNTGESYPLQARSTALLHLMRKPL